ncbi:MAG: hypothetical protein ACJZ8M_01450 [Pseudohongiellaceae bacterium]|jgi:hypothetical protein|nr:hypothetical protein [Gammaproteobacteria bacterium]MAW39083.1 hypothetical protein [Gammaproteobacteria bacterium]|tara:strand:- start:2993 stop:3205 length:213 start_codon:yes stop_codon:yes gene_type:complete
MKKILGFIQLFLALLLIILALATGFNLILISMRPETISVVNVIIGQGVLIVLLLAFANLCLKKGRKTLDL